MKSQRDAIIALAIGFGVTAAIQIPWVIEAHIAKAERIAGYDTAASAGIGFGNGNRG